MLRTDLMDPVDRVLVACNQVDLDRSDNLEVVAELCRQPLDWQRLVLQAQVHGVIGWVHEVFLMLEAGTVSDEVLDQLKRARIAHTVRVAMMGRDLGRVSRELDAKSVDHILLKGPYLAEYVYKRPDLRYYTDLDLMVREADVGRAGKVLTELGYQLVEEEDKSFFAHGKTQVHYYREGCLPIDLHWKLINLPTHETAFSVDQAEIWQAARRVEVAGVSIMSLSPEDTLLFQCVHMTAHHDCNRLQWFKDVEQVILRFGGELDWKLFVDKTIRYRLKTFVYYALALTGDVCRDLEIPEWALESLRPRYMTARLFERLLRDTNILELQDQRRRPALEVWRVMRDDRGKRYGAVMRRVFPKVGWYLECYPFLPKIRQPNYYYIVYPALLLLRLIKRPKDNL